ncbi:MAG: prenyltransferase [Clostridia bacterium]|jgi:4-hydroxybenzoate polyprenyltransferase|nr:prenyltransferase [Clostridia bacterium]
MKEYIKLMRPKHYLKNLLVFLPIVFSGNLFNIHVLTKVCVAFAVFCLISSIVYIVNDVKDVESDKKHETKKNRPIASGKVSPISALILAVVLFFVSVSLNFAIFDMKINFWANSILAIYLLLNIFYSFGLKNKPIIDIVILVSGFLLRVLYGSVVVGVEVSNWLYLTVIAGSFYLGLGKRRNEIKKQGSNARAVLKYYTHDFLDKNMYVCLALSIVFYSLWCVDVNTISRIGNNYLIWSVPVVMVIFMKYSLNIENDSYGDPVDVVFSDKALLSLIASYIIALLLIIYAF